MLVSGIQRTVEGEPDTHLVQAAVLREDGQALAEFDLGIQNPEGGATAWAYLTNRLTETIVQFYAPRPREGGDLNPRLGCWGPRPDLVEKGLGQSDCALATIVGASVWIPGANPPAHERTFLDAVADTLVEAVSYWVLVAEKAARLSRGNGSGRLAP